MRPRTGLLAAALPLAFSFVSVGGPVTSAQVAGPRVPPPPSGPPPASQSGVLVRLPDTVQPRRYKVELELNPASDRFHGRVDIELTIGENVDRIVLHATRDLDLKRAELLPATGGAVGQVVRIERREPDLIELVPPQRLPKGPAVVRIDYFGRLPVNEGAGLFRERDGNDFYIYSDFEPFDARRAFPCFDEPSFKVPWQLSLVVPQPMVAVSNARMKSETVRPGGLKLVEFEETLPLPTYLWALAVGPFDVVESPKASPDATPVRTLTLRGRGAEARYSAEITPEILRRLEEYTGIRYPYGKLDQIAVPNQGGAMENAGLVTYGQRLIQLGPANDTVGSRRRFARVCAHELAHQWTGNLVTLAFWDDTWLNESFASFLESKIIEGWQPTWGERLDRLGARHHAMAADSLSSARRIRQPITRSDDIINAFDAITYSKGQSVLTMFESFVGKDSFRKGLQRYLREHANKNATAADFIGAVRSELFEAASAESGKSIATADELSYRGSYFPSAMASFLDQEGVPVVGLSLRCDKQPVLRWRQARYAPLGSELLSPQQQRSYQIPLCVSTGPAASDQLCTLLDGPSGELPLARCPDYVLGNPEASGYYHVRYEGDLVDRIGRQYASLSEIARVNLLWDLWAMTRSGQLPVGEAFRFAARAAGESGRHLPTVAARMLLDLRDAVPPELLPQYRRLLVVLFGSRLDVLGLKGRPQDSDDDRLLRGLLLKLVVGEGADVGRGASARQLLSGWLRDKNSLDSESALALLEPSAQWGDAALFELLLGAALKEPDRNLRTALLGALGSFREPTLARRGLGLILDGRFVTREAMPIFYGVAYNPETRALASEFLERSFDTLVAKLPRDAAAGFPRAFAGACTIKEREYLGLYFGNRSTRYLGGERVLRQVLERVSLCLELRRNTQEGLSNTLSTLIP